MKAFICDDKSYVVAAVLLCATPSFSGVDILQKKPKNAQGGINSAQAKFPESLKKVFLLPRNEEIMMFFALNCHF